MLCMRTSKPSPSPTLVYRIERIRSAFWNTRTTSTIVFFTVGNKNIEGILQSPQEAIFGRVLSRAPTRAVHCACKSRDIHVIPKMATKNRAIEGRQNAEDNENSIGILDVVKNTASFLYHSEFSRFFIS